MIELLPSALLWRWLELLSLKWLNSAGCTLWYFSFGLHLCQLGFIWHSSDLVQFEIMIPMGRWGDPEGPDGWEVRNAADLCCRCRGMIQVHVDYNSSDPHRFQWEWVHACCHLFEESSVKGYEEITFLFWKVFVFLIVWFKGEFCRKPGKLSLSFTMA